MTTLDLEPLGAAAFAPFGTLIGFDPARGRLVNEGTAHRADTDALFDHASATVPVLALYRVRPQRLPLRLSLFERHPYSSQSFVSLSVSRFVIVVAPSGPDGFPMAERARAFIGPRGAGISYRRDQWHMPVIALGTKGDLLMLIAERGTPDDCIEHRLTIPLTLRSDDPRIFEGPTHGD